MLLVSFVSLADRKNMKGVYRNEEIANQSLVSDFLYSRWESNPNLRFRKPPFYPLNYRSIVTSAGVIAKPADALVITSWR